MALDHCGTSVYYWRVLVALKLLSVTKWVILCYAYIEVLASNKKIVVPDDLFYEFVGKRELHLYWLLVSYSFTFSPPPSRRSACYAR